MKFRAAITLVTCKFPNPFRSLWKFYDSVVWISWFTRFFERWTFWCLEYAVSKDPSAEAVGTSQGANKEENAELVSREQKTCPEISVVTEEKHQWVSVTFFFSWDLWIYVRKITSYKNYPGSWELDCRTQSRMVKETHIHRWVWSRIRWGREKTQVPRWTTSKPVDWLRHQYSLRRFFSFVFRFRDSFLSFVLF